MSRDIAEVGSILVTLFAGPRADPADPASSVTMVQLTNTRTDTAMSMTYGQWVALAVKTVNYALIEEGEPA